MGGYFSKIGSDPYYANYDKSLQRLKTDIDKLKDKQRVRQRQRSRIGQSILLWGLALFVIIALFAAWVLRQPQGTYTASQHALRVSPIIIEPVGAFGLHYCVFGLLRLRDRRLDRRLKTLNKKMKQMIHDLKDSTRYEKTHQLLEKYDPEYVPHTPRGTPRNATFGSANPSIRHRNITNAQSQSSAGSMSPAALLQRTAGLAGSRVVPMLNSIAGMVGDNPDLMNGLNAAKSEALKLKAENESLRQKVLELKAQLGEDTGSEQDMTSPRGRVGSQAVRSLDNIEDVSDELSNHSGNAATDMSDAKENIPGGQDLKSAHQHQTVSESRSSAAQADQNDGKKVR